MDFKILNLTDEINKPDDKYLSFRVIDYSDKSDKYALPHKKHYFCVVFVISGSVCINIEDRINCLKEGKIVTLFPGQIHHFYNGSKDFLAKMLLFEEVLFCSDILKNELSVYDVSLTQQLNNLALSSGDFSAAMVHLNSIETIYNAPSLIKKEQGRFYIKILLLGLIETIHGSHPLMHHDADRKMFVEFKKMVNTHFKEYRHVGYYSDQLLITKKKLNEITKKHCGINALAAIHERLLTEIKRLMLYSDLSHKQIALDLGFSSPSALNKFIKTKLKETPTDLQNKLEQIYIS